MILEKRDASPAMNEELGLLVEIYELLSQQIEMAQKQHLTPEETSEYFERGRRITELAEQLTRYRARKPQPPS